MKTYFWKCTCGREMRHETKPAPGQLCFDCGGKRVNEILSYTQVKGLDVAFAVLVQKHAKLGAAIGQLEVAKKELAAEIGEALDEREVKSVFVDRLQATRCKGRESSKISGPKLLENGVDSAVIKACTVTSTGKPYVLVTDTSKPRGKREAA